MIIKVWCFIVLLPLLSSCAHHASVNPDFYSENLPQYSSKIPLSVVISNKDKYIQDIHGYGDFGFQYVISLKTGLQNAVQKSLSNIFQDSIFENAINSDKKYDLLVTPKFELLKLQNESKGLVYYTNIELIFENFRTKKQIARYNKKDEIIYHDPPSTGPLMLFTGATIFLISPITYPIIQSAQAKQAVKLFENAITESVNKLTDNINSDNERLLFLLNQKQKKTPLLQKEERHFTSTEPQSQVPSKFDIFLDSVVVIESSSGTGSGFFVSSNGYLITNSHVVGSDSVVSITLRDKKVLLGQVIESDIIRDLALLKIDATGHSWLMLGTLSDAQIGEDVLAIGAPKGLTWSISKGIVSAVRNFDGINVIQTDAAINPGNSGGPLISLKNGKVVGVNTFGYRKDQAEGLNFAISSQDIQGTFPMDTILITK